MCSGPQHSSNHMLIRTVNHTTWQYKFSKKLRNVCFSSTLISREHLACNVTMAQNGDSLLQFLETKAGQIYSTGQDSFLCNSSGMASLHNLQFSGKYLHIKCLNQQVTTSFSNNEVKKLLSNVWLNMVFGWITDDKTELRSYK